MPKAIPTKPTGIKHRGFHSPKGSIATKPFPEPGEIDPNTGIGQAILKATSISQFAKAVGVSHQAASRWNARGFVPPGRVEQISGIYAIPKAKLASPKLVALLTDDTPLADFV